MREYVLDVVIEGGTKMRTLNVIFSDKEFRKLQRTKKNLGLTWHDLVLSVSE